MSPSKVVTLAAKDSSSVSRSVFSSVLPILAFSFSRNSFSQWSLDCTSIACWSFRSATSLSMTFFTSAKLSNSTDTASVASCARGPPAAPTAGSGPRRPCHAANKSSVRRAAAAPAAGPVAATRRNVAAARPRNFARAPSDKELEASCKSVTAFAMTSLASSSFRIASASVTALSSSERVADRSCHCLSKPWHWSFKLERNSTSAARCPRVNSKPSFASDNAFWFSA
mmetsp:Transcript_121068/g.342555  ORF Transcript_121068/g.342555 Transcript_121068/m.342555 type:complete len:227 (-) Transcript_121068:1218-1898(-)